MSAVQVLNAYDWWPHTTGLTASFPKGDGTAVASAGASPTGVGKRVLLHSIQRLPSASATGNLTIMDAAGATYFTWPGPGNVNGANTPIDIQLNNGLSVAATVAAENWLVTYSVIH